MPQNHELRRRLGRLQWRQCGGKYYRQMQAVLIKGRCGRLVTAAAPQPAAGRLDRYAPSPSKAAGDVPGNFAYQTPRAVNANSGTTLRRNADAGLPFVAPQDRRGVGDGLAGVNVAA
jgi:hypothetical protein